MKTEKRFVRISDGIWGANIRAVNNKNLTSLK